MEKEFSDYIVYVDESGDHGLAKLDNDYPIFVLAFCIFNKAEYIQSAVPKLQAFKFRWFGHDLTIMHENEIRKQKNAFTFLNNKPLLDQFMKELSTVIDETPFTIVSVAIRKDEYIKQGKQINPYHVALEFGLERVFYFLQEKGQHRKTTHVVFESRGKNEDQQLELEFLRILKTSRCKGISQSFAFECVSKKVNSSGLQIADMIARPVGIKVLNPSKDNRAYEIIKNKIRRDNTGNALGWGLKIFP